MAEILQDKPTPELQLHWLTSSATDDQIKPVMALSELVFEGIPSDPNKHTSLAYWRKKLSLPYACMPYVAHPAEPDKPLGFFFNFPEPRDEIGHEALHIWMAGVTPEARGQGIFPLLFEKTRDHAKACGFEYMTVATVPGRFAKMYKILQAHGWEPYKSGGSGIDEHIHFKMKL